MLKLCLTEYHLVNTCEHCGEKWKALADNSSPECVSCTQTTFYALSPIFLTLYNTLINDNN